VTSEPQGTSGPNEQHQLLYIDPVLLDLRNSGPDQFVGPSNTPHGQDPSVEFPFTEASVSESQLPVESTFHSLHQAPVSVLVSRNASPISQQPSEPSFPCPSCLETFDKKYKLNRHSKSHSLPFKCDVSGCGGFRYRKDLNRHIETKHPEQVGFEGFHCPVDGCLRQFPRRDNLRRHMRRLHPEQAMT